MSILRAELRSAADTNREAAGEGASPLALLDMLQSGGSGDRKPEK